MSIKKTTNMTMNNNETKEKNSKEQNIDNKMPNSDKQFELYKQLHEQFANNDNNKTNNVISFIAAIFVVFGGYGVSIIGEDCFVILLSTFASQSFLLLLSILCLYFGYSTRRDQLIIFTIRKKYDVILPYKNPFCSDEERKIYNFLPDYYNIIFYACLFFIIAITIISFFKFIICHDSTYILLLFIFLAIELCLFYEFCDFYYKKYEEFKKRDFSPI